jgi:hypothetical protein
MFVKLITEYLNLIFLLLGLYGMYQGVEIQHPLYAILFLNLSVALFFTALDTIAFNFIPSDKFLTLSNTISGLSLFFHCTCWCMTSIIRYIYIFHDNWIQDFMPSHKRQCHSAFALSILFSVGLSVPVYGYAFYLGMISQKNFYSVSFKALNLFEAIQNQVHI